MTMELRRGRPGDEGALEQIDQVCFETPWSRESFSKELSNPTMKVYVMAWEKKQPVGYAGLWIIEKEGHITNVAVVPLWQKQGLGMALLKKLMEETGLERYTLEVAASNKRALKLYEKAGFVSAGKRPRYYGKDDAIIMWYENQ